MSLANYKDLVKVVIVDDNATTITGTLGITQERQIFLKNLIDSCFEKHDTVTDMMVYVSNGVVHPNELAYCVYHIGSNVGKNKIINELMNI